jgi:hypothetical protein
MPIFCIDDGGDGTQTDTTQTAGTLDWSKADTSIANLIATYASALTTSGNIIYFGSNTVQTQASALTVVGPASDLPVIFISADITNATPTYLKGTTNQIETTGNNGSHVWNRRQLHGRQQRDCVFPRLHLCGRRGKHERAARWWFAVFVHVH